VAKRTSRKQGGRKRAGAKRTRAAVRKRTARTSARGSQKRAKGRARPKAARRKNAARGAASRRTRTQPRSKSTSTLTSAATAVRGTIAGAVAVVSDKLPWSSGEPDAITLLENDHRRLEALLKQGEETTERAVKGRTKLLDTLTSELTVHELVEEKLLYPALEAHAEAREIVLEGYQEHHIADIIVNELHDVAKDDEQWGAKFKVLKENLEHHIQEEEGEMFRTARAVLSREELHTLGARMAAMKAKAR